MKNSTMLAAAGFAAALVLLPVVALSQSPPPPAKLETPKDYLPGLDQFMREIQIDHSKLGIAANARNWELATFEIGILQGLLSDVQTLVSTYTQLKMQNTIIGVVATAIGPLTELQKAVVAKDLGKFWVAYDKLTKTCNSCHEAADRGFIVIRRPTASYYSNQDFEPRKQGGTAPK